MTTLTLPKDKLLNTVVYMEYDTISEILTKQYGKDPLEIDFFIVIQKKLEKYKKLRIIDFLVIKLTQQELPELRKHKHGLVFRKLKVHKSDD